MNPDNYTILAPGDIEKRSFEIIESELQHLNVPEEYKSIIYRVIHTSADFEYGYLTELHPDAISNATEALSSGCNIYTDTNMILSGVSKASLKKLNCNAFTYIADPEVAKESKAKNITRSIIGIDKAAKEMDGGIFVIGNAPTALVRISELIKEGKVKPALVIGVPVGFVGAAESKEMIKTTGVPYIVVNGRKGGSTIAVAILNALLYKIHRE